jgi:RimJ/RimL family protein N-acetyltransferase
MLSNDVVTIRAIQRSDLEFLRNLRNDPSIWQMLGSIGFIHEQQQEQWFDLLLTDPTREYYIILANKTPDHQHFKAVGMVRIDEIDHINRNIRIGADIKPEFQGKGYGTAVYELLFEYCFDYWNMHRVWLLALATNERAIGLYKKMGMKEEGRYREGIYRCGNYHDYICLSMLEHEYRSRSHSDS